MGDTDGGIGVRNVSELSPAERRALFERDAEVEAARADAREIVERSEEADS